MTKAATALARRTQAPQSLRAYLDGPARVSQRELADAVGCNQSMISMLVRGKRVPSAGLAVELHATTGVPLKMLLAPRLAPLAAARSHPGKRRRLRPPRSPTRHAHP